MLTVEICLGTSCHLMGAQDLVDAIEALPAEVRREIEVKGVTCFKNCGKGPNIRINGELVGQATPDRIIELIYASL